MSDAPEAQRSTGISKNSKNTSELRDETVWEVLQWSEGLTFDVNKNRAKKSQSK